MDKYQETYNVGYQSLDSDLAVTFPQFLNFIQDTSIRHTDSTIYPMRWYTSKRTAWVIINWNIRVTGYPRLNEKIIITTFPIQFKGVVGDRGFEAFDESGKMLLTAYTSWAYVDLEKNKLARPSTELIESFGDNFPAPMSNKMDFIPLSEPGTPYYQASKREFLAMRRDTDPNKHVNNVKYIEWAIDEIPDDIYKTARVREAKVNYKRQCWAGDKVTSELYWHTTNPLSFATVFKSQDGAVLAEVYTLWDSSL